MQHFVTDNTSTSIHSNLVHTLWRGPSHKQFYHSCSITIQSQRKLIFASHFSHNSKKETKNSVSSQSNAQADWKVRALEWNKFCISHCKLWTFSHVIEMCHAQQCVDGVGICGEGKCLIFLFFGQLQSVFACHFWLCTHGRFQNESFPDVLKRRC